MEVAPRPLLRCARDLLWRLIVVLFLLVPASPSKAEEVIVTISGAVTSIDDPNGLLPAGVTIGTTLNGVYRMDVEEVISATENPPGSVLHVLDPLRQPTVSGVLGGVVYSSPIYGIGISDGFNIPTVGLVDLWVTALLPSVDLAPSLTFTDTTLTRIDDPFELFAESSLSGWTDAFLDISDTNDVTPAGARALARASVQSLRLLPSSASDSIDDFELADSVVAPSDGEVCFGPLAIEHVASGLRCIWAGAGSTASVESSGFLVRVDTPGSIAELRYPFSVAQNFLWATQLVLQVETTAGLELEVTVASDLSGDGVSQNVVIPGSTNGPVWVTLPLDPRDVSDLVEVRVSAVGGIGQHRLDSIQAVPEPGSRTGLAVGWLVLVAAWRSSRPRSGAIDRLAPS